MSMPGNENRKLTVTVSQVNEAAARLIGGDKRFVNIAVKGEISECRIHAKSGHMYFTLKDESSLLKGVMWASNVRRLDFEPAVGDKVIVNGGIKLYKADGTLEIEAAALEREDGFGEQAKAKRELYNKLNAEGLFSRHRPCPERPKRIAVVTAPGSAAEKDIVTVIGRRCPIVTLILIPALVQGENAPASLVRAMNDAQKTGAELIIIGRGGGGADDLSTFDSEAVVRAVYNSTIPTICAVGHEINTSLSDYAADVRASTPSAAAELAVPDLKDIRREICGLEEGISGAIKKLTSEKEAELDSAVELLRAFSPKKRLLEKEHRLDAAEDKIKSAFHSDFDKAQAAFASRMENILSRSPMRKIDEYSTLLDNHARQVYAAVHNRLNTAENSFRSRCDVISALNPMSVLKRGYSVTRVEGKCVLDAAELSVGDIVETGLSSGSFSAVVKEIKK